MKIVMKEYLKKAMDWAKQYKSWEMQIVAKASYAEGYRAAMKDAEYLHNAWGPYYVNYINTQITEVEFTNGEHQLIDDIH